MADALEIKDIETLTDLRTALVRFSGDVRHALQAAESQVQQTLEWLDERVRYWQREVERAIRLVQQAEAALSRCESSGYYDEDGYYHQPDCSREHAALRAAEDHLRECRENLRTAQEWRSRVNQSADAYYRQARHLEGVAGGHSEKAAAQLNTLREKYEAVRQVQVTAGVAGAIAGGVVALGAVLASRLGDTSEPEVGLEDLQPNTTYRRGPYEFQTNERGWPKSVSGKLVLQPGSRNEQLQRQIGKLGRITDEGGHLIGARFNGPADAFNVVPQDPNLNASAYKKMENSWAAALESGHEVRVLMDLPRSSWAVRPSGFQVVYQIDLENPQYVFFRNRPG